MLNVYQEIRAQLTADVQAAWGIAAGSVFYGPLRLDPTKVALPFANIVLSPVPRRFVGARTVEEAYEFTIRGRFRMPAAGTDLEGLKVEKLAALGALLAPDDDTTPGASGSAYAGVVGNRQVTECSTLPDLNEGGEAEGVSYFYVTLTFTCVAHRAQ